MPGPLSTTLISAPRVVSLVLSAMTGVSVNLALGSSPFANQSLGSIRKQVNDGALKPPRLQINQLVAKPEIAFD